MRSLTRESVSSAGEFISPRAVACALALLLALAAAALAQSTRFEAPSPVTTAEISGRIPPLDLGDPRLTRHFYTFSARPGDLELTVETSNLEGEIDLFTATTLRPLTKVTLFGGTGETVSRTVFFRREEPLVLRVQARSPNDADGAYRIRLGGAFAPAPPSAIAAAEAASAEAGAQATPTPRLSNRNTRRVNSVGARIEEPRVEVAAEAPAPTPAAPERAADTAPTPSARTSTSRTRTPRRAPARTPAPRRAETATPTSEGAKTAPREGEAAERAATNTETARGGGTRPTTNRSGRTRAPTRRATNVERPSERASTNPPASSEESRAGSSGEAAAVAPAPVGIEAPGARLVIELRGGERYVREMSEVRRVTVERGLVVITLRSGRIERQPTANVLRMSIEP